MDTDQGKDGLMGPFQQLQKCEACFKQCFLFYFNLFQRSYSTSSSSSFTSTITNSEYERRQADKDNETLPSGIFPIFGFGFNFYAVAIYFTLKETIQVTLFVFFSALVI